jgi:N-methylhydantoinase B
VVREVVALEPCELSILSDRRRHAPLGAGGGSAGTRGRNAINGREVGPKARVLLSSGDVVTIETPGGGGYGAA